MLREDCDVEDGLVNYKSDNREDCDVEDGLVNYKSGNKEGAQGRLWRRRWSGKLPVR